MLRITLVRSPIGRPENHRATCRALGLTRLNRSVVLEDNPAVRGMANKVRHLVRVEDVGPADEPSRRGGQAR